MFQFYYRNELETGYRPPSGKSGKRVVYLSKAFQKYEEMTYETFFKIFDSKVQPILPYSFAIRGLQRLENIEKKKITSWLVRDS